MSAVAQRSSGSGTTWPRKTRTTDTPPLKDAVKMAPCVLYLKLQVLAPVVPLEEHAALTAALVEAPERHLVLVHLLQNLGGQRHRGLVVPDGQDEHVARVQPAFG